MDVGPCYLIGKWAVGRAGTVSGRVFIFPKAAFPFPVGPNFTHAFLAFSNIFLFEGFSTPNGVHLGAVFGGLAL